MIEHAAVILMNGREEVLLQQRDDRADLPYAAHWTLPGGSIEAGETPAQGAARELIEEMEMRPALRFWKTVTVQPPDFETIRRHVYTGRLDVHAEDITLHEGQAVRFLLPQAIERLPLVIGFGELLNEFYGAAPVVSAVMLNGRGEVLMQLRDEKPGLEFAGHWTLPGGMVEAGETPDEAIMRELDEEMALAIELEPVEMHIARRGPEKRVMVRQHIYSGRLDVPAGDIELHEGQAVRFFAPDALDELEIAFDHRATLAAALEQIAQEG